MRLRFATFARMYSIEAFLARPARELEWGKQQKV